MRQAAAIESELNEGVGDAGGCFQKLKALDRNSRKSVDTVFRKHNLHLHFEFIVSREDSKLKPAPDPIFLLSKRMNVHTDHLLMVGDYKYDIMCGKARGQKQCCSVTESMLKLR